MNKIGPISLVGAGPGDPELLTVRALHRLQAADVVLSDDLVDARVLALVKPGARIVYVGKRGGCVSTEQRFIHELMIREASAGLNVVRLKGGDPFVFGRGGEEMDALRAAGITVEVVSGLTAGIAAPASIGIPVTDRRHAPGVAFVTGHNREDAQAGTGQNGPNAPTGPNWHALARSGLTLVIYMGLARVESLVAALSEDGGLPLDTPAAAISATHTLQQRSVICTLAELPATLRREAISSPAILVIGPVVNMAHTLNEIQTLEMPQAWRA
ncbi:uroporphyrinogen-III C-methyltransferase [Roseateles koreensis]|uniref:uroporphyrinogen-III C-methyltransferase n=1 Tax=Roseateles koreensis TaxID=2987526 RepID=A0ABT5KUL2_9BURK|nr:uroporphyrinogen-III C-methyltransferase [Roseateles koreensis]MDC8786633.1 uroporphyrinogen-III C-methyltransferase [Roseateles koreensis]